MNTFKTFLVSRRVMASMLLALLLSIGAVGSVAAQTVLQGYGSDEKLQRGMIVTLSANDQTKLETVKDDAVEKMKGVVADPNDSPVTIGTSDPQYYVATTGRYEVLVSDENGPINSGDYISISSMAGIGMKVNETQSVIVGRAVSKFEGTTGDSIGKTQAKNGKTVNFGRIQVDIGITTNPVMKMPDKDRVPDALQKISSNIADKPVSALRIYLAMMVLIITAFVAGTTLFSGVRSTVISIGRNPLSKGIIYKGLLQVLILSLIIFITGIFGVYLLIRL